MKWHNGKVLSCIGSNVAATQVSVQYCLGVAKSREVRVKSCAVQCGDGWAMTHIVMFWYIYVLIRVGTVRPTYLVCVKREVI